MVNRVRTFFLKLLHPVPCWPIEHYHLTACGPASFLELADDQELPTQDLQLGFIMVISCLQRWLMLFRPRKSEINTKSQWLLVSWGIFGLLMPCCSWDARPALYKDSLCSRTQNSVGLLPQSVFTIQLEESYFYFHTESSFLLYSTGRPRIHW